MNKGTKLLLSAINSFLLGAGLMAQKPAWIQGDHVVDFREAYAGDPESYPLPIPTDVGADERYNGQIAARSQYLQLDDQGKVLFFIVDGRIYDRKGYLIADNVDDVDCSECVRKGISGVAVLQVPGSCTRYYVFTTAENSSTLPYLAWASVLDLEAPNPHFSGDSNKKGRLLSYTELDLAGFDLPFDWGSTSFGGSRDVLFALNDED